MKTEFVILDGRGWITDRTNKEETAEQIVKQAQEQGFNWSYYSLAEAKQLGFVNENGAQ